MKLLILTTFGLLLSYADLTVAQTCNPNIIATAPDSRYTLNANGTLVDKKTGLMWMRCGLGQTLDGTTCTGSIQIYNWQGALQIAESTAFAGFSDWRLPNNKELQSLVERRCYDPAINLTAFPNMPWDLGKDFWSSSPYAYDSSSAWITYFFYGYDFGLGGKGYHRYVLLVRGGQ